MFIIGELINSTRKAIKQAIQERDHAYLQDLARLQAEAGANAIDINVATGGNEVEQIQWAVDLVQEITDVTICLDSPNPLALEAGLKRCKSMAMINSISAEKERWDSVLPLVRDFKSKVVALCMDDKGMPKDVIGCLSIAEKLVNGLTKAGIPEDDIYLDPLIKPICVDHNNGLFALEVTRAIREKYPNVHIISGLSNISYGLPERRLINRSFMVMSVALGMDAFILDPLDQTMMSLLSASTVLVGKDEYCMNYITNVRAGLVKA